METLAALDGACLKKRWEHGSNGMGECSVTHGEKRLVSRTGLRAEPMVLICYLSVLCVVTCPRLFLLLTAFCVWLRLPGLLPVYISMSVVVLVQIVC